MDYNKINSMMNQQLTAVKVLEELLDLDAKQEHTTHAILQDDIDTLAGHVDYLKKVCDTAVALAKHYQGLEKKDDSKVVVAEIDAPGEPDEPAKEPPKAKRHRAKPKVEPEPEDDDDDDLFS
jgi:hypothetical protein